MPCIVGSMVFGLPTEHPGHLLLPFIRPLFHADGEEAAFGGPPVSASKTIVIFLSNCGSGPVSGERKRRSNSTISEGPTARRFSALLVSMRTSKRILRMSAGSRRGSRPSRSPARPSESRHPAYARYIFCICSDAVAMSGNKSMTVLSSCTGVISASFRKKTESGCRSCVGRVEFPGVEERRFSHFSKNIATIESIRARPRLSVSRS